MSDLLFSRTFNCLWFPCFNLPPKSPSQILDPFSPSIPFPRRFIFTSIRHTHVLSSSTSSSTPFAPQQPEQNDDDVDVISSTQRSDGSFVFTFGNASEIKEMIAELNKKKLVPESVVEEGSVSVLLNDDGVEKFSNEDDNSNLGGEEIESSSTVVVADQNSKLLASENESSVVLDSYPESETPVINDLQIIDKHLKLDSVEDGDDGQHGICSEDVAAEPNVVSSVSKEIVVSTVSPDSDMFSDHSSGTTGEVEEKEVDNGRSVDKAAKNAAGGVDAADLTELVQVSTFLESDHSVNRTTNNLIGSVDADISELEAVSTSLESELDDYSAVDKAGSVDADITELVPLSTSSESEQVDYSATDNLTGSVDADITESVPVSTSLESEQDDLTASIEAARSELVSVPFSLESKQVNDSEKDVPAGSVDTDNSELVPVSASLESERVDYSAADDLAGGVEAVDSELVPMLTSLETEQVTDNLTGSVDATISELVPVSPSVESEQVDCSAADDLAGGVEADDSELVPVSPSVESEQVDYSAANNLAGGVDADDSELVLVSPSVESERVDYSAADDLAGSVDADDSELVPMSTSLESEQVIDNLTGSVDAAISGLVPISPSVESEQVDYSAADDLAGGVDADDSELVPVSLSVESEQVDYSAADDLAGGVDADDSELVPMVTSLESEQVDYSATDNLTGSVDTTISELVPESPSLESEQVDYSATDTLTGSVDSTINELVPVSPSLESEQVDYNATDNLACSVDDANNNELVSVSTTLDSEQVDYSASDNLTGSVDDGIIGEFVPVPTSLDSEQSVNRETDHLTDGGDAELSESVPISTSLELEQVDYIATDNLTSGVDAELSESVPISTSLEPEQVDYRATDSLTGGVDADLRELPPSSPSLGSELHANDDETSNLVVDNSVDASELENSVLLLDDLVPSSDLEKKIDVGNTERSDYENPLLNTVSEIHPVELASDGENISKTELLLVSGAVCLPHPSEALTSREDAYIISPQQNWLVVADGVGQWSLEGSNTGVYIRELMGNCENIVSNYENISTIKPAEVIFRSAAETQSPGSSSVLVAYFDGQALHAANVGNTGFIIIRHGSIFKISNAMFHEFSFPIHIVKGDDHSEIIEEYKIDLHDGDGIVFGTNGLFDNLYEQEIASTISRSLQASLKPQDIAEILPKRRRSLSSFCSRSIPKYKYSVTIRTRICAVKKEEGALVEERVSDVKRNGNGAATKTVVSSSNGSVRGYVNGSGNGSLVKYVNGNGVAGEVVEDFVKEVGRKKRLEEIGKEDAWFRRRNGEPQVEVAVAPGGRWSRFKTYSTIQRTLEIWGFVITFIFKSWLNRQKFSYKGGMTEEKKTFRRKTLAKWLKESILRLGPTFIKIGQQFSTRVDILPQEYVDQLSELQDQVPPFPSETAMAIVEEELGAPIAGIFDQFDYEPIAAASLGQVHRARLRGQEVVIKVQRPGLKDLFDIDLKNLRVIAEYLQKIDPKSDGAKRDWVAIYDECASVLYQEIDYTKEAANAELFASNFKNMDYVKVPSIFWDYTTPQILTMEYVPGIKINKIEALDQLGVDRKRLGRYAVESYLEQILSHGFFHADPHPGNIAVDDVNGGRLIFYDFGMMGSISQNIREGLLEAFYGIYEKSPDKVLEAMIQMGVLVPTGDMTAVRRTAQFFLNSFEERLAAQRREKELEAAEVGFKKPLSKEEIVMKKKERLAAIGEDLLSIAADQPFRFPATFTFVVRAFSVLDGIGKGLDPRFDITEIAKPYALELLRFREAGVEVIIKDIKKRWDRQSQAFYNLFRQADRVEKLANVIERLEQGDLKLRVRALESERAFQRIATVQKTILNAVAVGSLINLATILSLNSIRVPATIAYFFCSIFGFQVLFGIVKIKKLDERERLITGTA